MHAGVAMTFKGSDNSANTSLDCPLALLSPGLLRHRTSSAVPVAQWCAHDTRWSLRSRSLVGYFWPPSLGSSCCGS